MRSSRWQSSLGLFRVYRGYRGSIGVILGQWKIMSTSGKKCVLEVIQVLRASTHQSSPAKLVKES